MRGGWIKIFTFLSKVEIDTIIEEHKKDASKRLLQKTLAKELTIFVHSNDAYEKAVETTQKLFDSKNASVDSLSENDLNSIEGIVKATVQKTVFENGIDITSLFTDIGIFPSKGEAKKMIMSGGVSINRNKIEDPRLVPDKSMLLHNKFLLVQKGKKNYYLIEVV